MSDLALRRELVHRTVVVVRAGDEWSPVTVASVVAEVVSGHDLGVRPRHEVRLIGSLTVSYFRNLAPPQPWIVEAKDAHLLWSEPGSPRAFADVVSVRSAEAALWTAHSRALPRRLLTTYEADNPFFLGVRLVAPAAPGRSMVVVHPTEPPRMLVDGSLWFASPLVPAEVFGRVQ